MLRRGRLGKKWAFSLSPWPVDQELPEEPFSKGRFTRSHKDHIFGHFGLCFTPEMSLKPHQTLCMRKNLSDDAQFQVSSTPTASDLRIEIGAQKTEELL